MTLQTAQTARTTHHAWRYNCSLPACLMHKLLLPHSLAISAKAHKTWRNSQFEDCKRALGIAFMRFAIWDVTSCSQDTLGYGICICYMAIAILSTSSSSDGPKHIASCWECTQQVGPTSNTHYDWSTQTQTDQRKLAGKDDSSGQQWSAV